jgi:hypothetical protein
MTKVILVNRCFECPCNTYARYDEDLETIACWCNTCGALCTGNNKVDIKISDPIPEWCPLKDIESYGWVLRDDQRC